MCFVINKNYAGGMSNNYLTVGKQKNPPAKIADLVAVQDSGVRNVINIGHGSALVETAMTPRFKEKK